MYDIWYALTKTVVFAFIITSVSAYHGYYTSGGALEVGNASTSGVVYSSIAIIFSNLILTNFLLAMIEGINITRDMEKGPSSKMSRYSFEKGKTNLIIGQSGMGKTVLLKCLVGLIDFEEGQVLYDERLFSSMTFYEKKAIRQEIGMLFQGGALFDSLNAEQNVMFPLTMFTTMSVSEKQDRANFCLSRVNLENANNFSFRIERWYEEKVAIARAIALNPKYLFCDEPNSGLDPQTLTSLMNLSGRSPRNMI